MDICSYNKTITNQPHQTDSPVSKPEEKEIPILEQNAMTMNGTPDADIIPGVVVMECLIIVYYFDRRNGLWHSYCQIPSSLEHATAFAQSMMTMNISASAVAVNLYTAFISLMRRLYYSNSRNARTGVAGNCPTRPDDGRAEREDEMKVPKIKVNRQWSAAHVRQVCVDNDLYTRGDNQYI